MIYNSSQHWRVHLFVINLSIRPIISQPKVIPPLRQRSEQYNDLDPLEIIKAAADRSPPPIVYAEAM